jgi:hypothetical protein
LDADTFSSDTIFSALPSRGPFRERATLLNTGYQFSVLGSRFSERQEEIRFHGSRGLEKIKPQTEKMNNREEALRESGNFGIG